MLVFDTECNLSYEGQQKVEVDPFGTAFLGFAPPSQNFDKLRMTHRGEVLPKQNGYIHPSPVRKHVASDCRVCLRTSPQELWAQVKDIFN